MIVRVSEEDGLPISNIGNLCYLPEFVNRSKKEKNFYQDSKYLKRINLSDVENKYSFTKKEDLEWMDMPYSKGDYLDLKKFYLDFLKKRFNIQKEKFYTSLGIK